MTACDKNGNCKFATNDCDHQTPMQMIFGQPVGCIYKREGKCTSDAARDEAGVK